MESDSNDTNFARDSLAAPAEVAGVEAQSTELAVASSCAYEMDSLGADTCVGGLAALLEGSVIPLSGTCVLASGRVAFGLCIPLLAIVCALSTSGTALVTGVTRDTVKCQWTFLREASVL